VLQLLDESLESFLRADVPLPAREVDVSFAAPDRDWAAGVSKPTVNLFLWDVRPNADQAELGLVTVTGDDGRIIRRGPASRIDCRFLVTAWTREVRDEHALLGRVLTAVLRCEAIAAEHLAGPLAATGTVPTLELRTGRGSDNSDFWSALGGQLKPGLDLTVTVTIDAADPELAGPPVETVLLRYGDPPGPQAQDGGGDAGGPEDSSPDERTGPRTGRQTAADTIVLHP